MEPIPVSAFPQTLCVPRDSLGNALMGLQMHCEMVLNQIAFLWQFYSKREKNEIPDENNLVWMHTVENIARQCILWKTHLPGAEIFTWTCSMLWASPFLRILSKQHDTVWRQKNPLTRFAFKITCANRRLELLESSRNFRVASGLAKLINSFGPHHS